MTSQNISDFITKQLCIKHNLVTYRSLSREFAIHVNAAKNELAEYHAHSSEHPQTSYATYLITGELPRKDVAMDMDDDDEDDEHVDSDGYDDLDSDEDVMETQVLLVNEDELEDAKANFSHVNAVHVYSLSPARIHDAGVLCEPTDSVRKKDGERDDVSAKVGRVVADSIVHLQVKADKKKMPPPPVPDTSKQHDLKTSKSLPTNGTIGSKVDKAMEQSKAKAAGKLDFFGKAKSKEPVKKEKPAANKGLFFNPKKKASDAKSREEEEEKPEKDTQAEPEPKKSSVARDTPADDKAAIEPKKPVKETKGKAKEELVASSKKRKSAVLDKPEDEDNVPAKSEPQMKKRKSKTTDSETDTASDNLAAKSKIKQSKPQVRVKRGIILSDDEDENAYRPRKSKTRAERELEQLMDTDEDDEVDRGQDNGKDHTLSIPDDDTMDTYTDGGDAMLVDDDEQVPKPKPRKRKAKKVAPLGRNGLPKKRVMRQRQSVDAKGYMITEDYSSYESASEDEGQPAAPMAKKAKGKARAEPSDGVDESDTAETADSSKTKGKEAASEKATRAGNGSDRQNLSAQSKTINEKVADSVARAAKSSKAASKRASSTKSSVARGIAKKGGQQKMTMFFAPPKKAT